MKKYLTYRNVLIATLVLLTLIFIAQNAEIVEVKFWFWTVSTPRSVVIFVSLLIGIIIGIFTSTDWFQKKLKKENDQVVDER